MNKCCLFLFLFFPFLASCNYDAITHPLVTEEGRDYVWCEVEDCNYHRASSKLSRNAARDSVYVSLSLDCVYGHPGDVELKDIEFRLAVQDIKRGGRIPLNAEQAVVRYSDGSNDRQASDVEGAVRIWKYTEGVFAGQFEFRCSAVPIDFEVEHGIFDLRLLFRL